MELVPWKEMSQSDFVREADVRIKMLIISNLALLAVSWGSHLSILTFV